MGLECGFSFDITVPDADGSIWDFSKKSCQQRAWRRLKDQRPYMLVGSPPCTAFSILQNLNAITPEGKARVEEARKRATINLQCCADMYREQMRGGRYFVHEHPELATSWASHALSNYFRSRRSWWRERIYANSDSSRRTRKERVRSQADQIHDQQSRDAPDPFQKMPRQPPTCSPDGMTREGGIDLPQEIVPSHTSRNHPTAQGGQRQSRWTQVRQQ